MSGFRVFLSNRMELLADALAETVRQAPRSPLERETVVVQSLGMERWLSMELASRLGVCAGFSFPFPNAFTEHLFRAVLPPPSLADPFDPDLMTWRIMAVLPELLTDEAFSGPAEFLRTDPGGLRLYQLARRMALLFDKYTVFRPEMILSWDKGEGDHWQAALWRRLAAGDALHKAARAAAFIRAVEEGKADNNGFPERVALFGISTLPPLYLRILQAASLKMTVNLFVLSPCCEYWGDIVSRPESNRIMADESSLSRGELHLGQGNSILASTGAMGREFLDLLLDLSPQEMELYEEPKGDSMLSLVQGDILHLREPSVKRPVRDDDESIQIHSCHSPMREMEVLQDVLLEMLERDPALSPADILIMTPDIEAYEPVIHAVFDLPQGDPRRIPYRVADRGTRQELLVLETFMKLLDLPNLRHRAPAVMEILRSPLVARRYQLLEEQLELLEIWIREAGIRWALDGQAKAQLRLPAFNENTWGAGIDRLLLGYALPSTGEGLFKGIAPCDLVEGSEATLLGVLAEFLEGIRTLSEQSARPHSPSEWSDILCGALHMLFGEQAEDEVSFLRNCILRLRELQDKAFFEEEVELPVIREYIKESLKGHGMGLGFLEGGMTFCALVPMRSIPRKVICLVGLNNETFPGRTFIGDLDLTLRAPRKGDRSRRKDDRYLFLEALLSARKAFCVTYVGQDIRDNSRIPPSAPVSDLLDYINETFWLTEARRERLWKTHRLQAFSPSYFDAKGPSSYSRDNFLAAKAMVEARVVERRFITEPLPLPHVLINKIGLEDLIKFFSNPARFLLKKRLGVLLEEPDAVLEEREPFELMGLERYKAAEALLSWMAEGKDPVELLAINKAAGLLPHGLVGDKLFELLRRDVEVFASAAAELRKRPKRGPVTFSISIEGSCLKGSVKDIYGSSLVRLRFARPRGKDLISIWIELLAANLATPGGEELDGIIAAWEKGMKLIRFKTPSKGEETLAELIRIYKQGLQAPLKFFPQSSFEYASKLLKDGKSPQRSLAAVLNSWTNEFMRSAESEDPYAILCFGNNPPLDEAFEELAKRIYGPLIEAMTEE
jgi:exodeoxyribonuclease V gamma subunit